MTLDGRRWSLQTKSTASSTLEKRSLSYGLAMHTYPALRQASHLIAPPPSSPFLFFRSLSLSYLLRRTTQCSALCMAPPIWSPSRTLEPVRGCVLFFHRYTLGAQRGRHSQFAHLKALVERYLCTLVSPRSTRILLCVVVSFFGTAAKR